MPQQSASKGTQVYRFELDGKVFESDKQVITGERIREIAGVEPNLRLFLGDHADGNPDHQIMHEAKVDLATLGKKKLYTLEPPTMDIY